MAQKRFTSISENVPDIHEIAFEHEFVARIAALRGLVHFSTAQKKTLSFMEGEGFAILTAEEWT
jgi:hypothetical protein